MISIETVVQTVVYLIVIGCVFWLLHFLINYIGLPEPFAKFARVFLVVCAVLILISLLLGLAGHPIVKWGALVLPFCWA
jgi:hypothetical protein